MKLNSKLIAPFAVAFAVAGVVAGASVLAGSSHPVADVQLAAGASANPSQDAAAVKATFTTALRLHQQLPVPPVATAGAAPDGVVRQKQLKAGTAKVQALFEPGPAAAEIKAQQNAITAEQAPDFRVLGGDASKISFSSVVVSGNTATAKGHAEVWSRMEQRGPDGKWGIAEPHNTINVVMTFVKKAGIWKVASFHWTFESGSAP
jgi:hypothetical protein